MTCFELGTRVPFILHVPWMNETAGSRTLQLTELIDGETHAAALLAPIHQVLIVNGCGCPQFCRRCLSLVAYSSLVT